MRGPSKYNITSQQGHFDALRASKFLISKEISTKDQMAVPEVSVI